MEKPKYKDSVPPHSRRAFLHGLSLITLAAASAPLPVRAAEKAGGEAHWAMLVDLRRCIGCQACTVSCIHENAMPSGYYRTIVASYAVRVSGQGAQLAGICQLPRLCNHCDKPACTRICPVGATFKRPDGIVVVDAERCVGCAYCVQACPYDARFINHLTGKADKCTFCAHRLEAGLLPACVESCVGGARLFGDLNNAGGELRRRLEEYRGTLRVLKPGMETGPQVFYLGLDERLTDKVNGTATLWTPSAHAASFTGRSS